MTESFALMRFVDHQAPEEEVGLIGILRERRVVQHHEPDQGIIVVDRAEPGLVVERRFCDRHRVRRHLCRAVAGVELAHCAQRFARDFFQETVIRCDRKGCDNRTFVN